MIHPTGEDSEGGLNNHMNRMTYIWLPRLYPHGNIAIAEEALNDYACQYQYVPSAYNPEWTCIGPTGRPGGSISSRGNGQIQRITFDPRYGTLVDGSINQTIYAASSFGGVWRSDDDGLNWYVLENLQKQLPYINVSDIAVSHQDPDLIYVSTGDGDYAHRWLFDAYKFNLINPNFSAGIFRSVDGGGKLGSH